MPLYNTELDSIPGILLQHTSDIRKRQPLPRTISQYLGLRKTMIYSALVKNEYNFRHQGTSVEKYVKKYFENGSTVELGPSCGHGSEVLGDRI